MIRRVVNVTLAVLLIIALASVAGCARSKSTGQSVPTRAPGTQPAQTSIPPAIATTVAAPPPQSTQPPQPQPTQPPQPQPTQPPQPQPTQPPQPQPTPVPPVTGPTTHVVQPGDWLWKIARQYNVSPQAIAEANKLIDPNALQPGQRLTIPGPGPTTPPASTPGTGQATYTVKSGDTLYSIARQYGKTVEALRMANGIANVNLIHPGHVLIIP